MNKFFKNINFVLALGIFGAFTPSLLAEDYLPSQESTAEQIEHKGQEIPEQDAQKKALELERRTLALKAISERAAKAKLAQMGIKPRSKKVKTPHIGLSWKPSGDMIGSLQVQSGGSIGTSTYANVKDFYSKWLGSDIDEFWHGIIYPRDLEKLDRDFQKLAIILDELGLTRTNPSACLKIERWRLWRKKELSELGLASSLENFNPESDPEKKASLKALEEFKTEFVRVMSAKTNSYMAFAYNDIVRQIRKDTLDRKALGSSQARDTRIFSSCTVADKTVEDDVANPNFCPQSVQKMGTYDLGTPRHTKVSEQVWTDLKVFYNEELNQTHRSLLSKVLCPYTIFGRVFAERMVFQPTYDLELLMARQEFIKSLAQNRELYDAVSASLSRIGACQTEIIEFIQKSQEMFYNKDLYIYPSGHFWVKNIVDQLVEVIPSTRLKNGYEHFLRNRVAMALGLSSRVAEEANDLVSGLGIMSNIGQNFIEGLEAKPVYFDEKEEILANGRKIVVRDYVKKSPWDALSYSCRQNVDYTTGLSGPLTKLGKFGIIPSIALFPKTAALNAIYCCNPDWTERRQRIPGPNCPIIEKDLKDKDGKWLPVLDKDSKAMLWGVRSFAALVFGVVNGLIAWSTVKDKFELGKKSLELARLSKKMVQSLATLIREAKILTSLFKKHGVNTKALTLLTDLEYLLGRENKDLAEVVKMISSIKSDTDLVTCASILRTVWPARWMFSMPLEALAQIDALTSFASLVVQTSDGKPNRYSFAKFEPTPVGQLQIEGVWFPYWPREQVVPSDVCLKGDPEAHNLMVGGRNGGGKSSYFRAITWAVLFAHVSGLVPCNGEAKFWVFDYINSQIQISDDPARGKSSHQKQSILMEESHRVVHEQGEADWVNKIMSDINRQPDQKVSPLFHPCRLVVIDECFKGTEPMAGAALGFAYFKRMAAAPNSIVVCSTHAAKMLEVQKYLPDIKFDFSAVLVDPQNKKDTYKIVPGKPNPQKDAMGIEVAEAMGADRGVIDDAKRYFDSFTAEQAVAAN